MNVVVIVDSIILVSIIPTVGTYTSVFMCIALISLYQDIKVMITSNVEPTIFISFLIFTTILAYLQIVFSEKVRKRFITNETKITETQKIIQV